MINAQFLIMEQTCQTTGSVVRVVRIRLGRGHSRFSQKLDKNSQKVTKILQTFTKFHQNLQSCVYLNRKCTQLNFSFTIFVVGDVTGFLSPEFLTLMSTLCSHHLCQFSPLLAPHVMSSECEIQILSGIQDHYNFKVTNFILIILFLRETAIRSS